MYEVKGEIEAWSQRRSGCVIEGILAVFVNVTQYQPFRRGSYMPLPKKLQIRTQSLTYKTETTCV